MIETNWSAVGAISFKSRITDASSEGIFISAWGIWITNIDLEAGDFCFERH